MICKEVLIVGPHFLYENLFFKLACQIFFADIRYSSLSYIVFGFLLYGSIIIFFLIFLAEIEFSPRAQELVSLSSYPLLKSPDISNAGKHLSAADFHSVLQNAGSFFFPRLIRLFFFFSVLCLYFWNNTFLAGWVWVNSIQEYQGERKGTLTNPFFYMTEH